MICVKVEIFDSNLNMKLRFYRLIRLGNFERRKGGVGFIRKFDIGFILI